MKKLLSLLFIIIITFSTLSASGSNDPNDEIYSDIDRWLNLGLIDRLPPIRPYPTQYLLSILDQVMTSDNEKEAETAEGYIEYYTSTGIDFELKSNNFSSIDETQTISGIGADINFNYNEYLTGGADINAYFLNDVDDDVIDPITSMGISVAEDNMGFSAFGTYWNIYQSLDFNAAFGTDTLWLQTGIMNTSFGPLFDDSVVMSPDAEQSAHFSATWIAEKFTFSYLFLPIVATDSEGNDATDDKYLHIHSIDFKLTDWWDFQFYESAIYGGEGIKPIFFLPFSEFFYAASVGETWDVNSLMGVSSRFQMPKNVSLTGTVYVDDLYAKDVITLDLDTKYKLAAQTEIDWTLENSFLNNITFSYTAIMPYMYTHTTEADEDNEYFDLFGTDYNIRSYALYTDINYENYTNNGLSMGPYGMEPNSDKFGLTFVFDAPHDYKINLSTFLQRHGNSSDDDDRDYDEDEIDWDYFYENYTADDADDDYSWATADGTGTDNDLNNFYSVFDTDADGVIDDAIDADGSIYDTGYSWNDGYLYNSTTNFLSQDILEYLWVTKLSVTSPTFELWNGEVNFNAGYTYVYIINQDLVEGDDFYGNYLSLAINYKF